MQGVIGTTWGKCSLTYRTVPLTISFLGAFMRWCGWSFALSVFWSPFVCSIVHAKGLFWAQYCSPCSCLSFYRSTCCIFLLTIKSFPAGCFDSESRTQKSYSPLFTQLGHMILVTNGSLRSQACTLLVFLKCTTFSPTKSLEQTRLLGALRDFT